ncbi:MAG: hypothetical protein ACT6RL_10970 [Neoaquamicrobium sediminum]|uniref:hypothetical protein n=1 Tax=Neoaquamicrobium sediminum TaxID=1849104 RepID=UPI0040371EAD
MEKTFTFRFYALHKNKAATPDMVGELRKIAAIQDKKAREKQLSQDYTIRLEEFEDDGTDAVVGELVRRQGTNFPSEIKGGARKALTVEGLGHGIVFRFNYKKGVLGIQHDARIISPGRLLDYLAAFNANAIYSITPKIDDKNWEKFNSGQTRKISIRIANPDTMHDLTGKRNKAAGEGIKAMSDAYDAPSILIELSMGHKKGFLSSAVGSLAKQLSKMDVPGFRLDKLSAVTVVNDASEEIDLIEERIVAKDTLDIDDRDPDKNYAIKKAYLIKEMKKLVG